MICDKCLVKLPPEKINKYNNEYLCDDCLAEEIPKIIQKKSLLNYIKGLFKKDK